jgi:hypothetical protein
MARLAREENETLKARVTALEARLAGANAPAAGSAGVTSAPPGSGGPQEPPGGYFA